MTINIEPITNNNDDLSSVLDGDQINSRVYKFLIHESLTEYPDKHINYRHMIYKNVGVIMLRLYLGFWAAYFNYNRVPHLVANIRDLDDGDLDDKDSDDKDTKVKFQIHGGICINARHFKDEDASGFGIDFGHKDDLFPTKPREEGMKYWTIEDVTQHAKDIIDISYELSN